MTYNGKELSVYDATQQQRHMERQIRKWKREASAMDAAGLDNGYAKDKIGQWQAAQRDFISQTGLRRDYFRERAGAQNLETPKKDDIIKQQLRGIGVNGKINLPPRRMDVDSLGFDDQHTNTDRHHDVTEAEAKSFIRNALVSTTKWDGLRENYYSYDGVAYVDTQKHEIRTAYKPREYRDYVRGIMEVLRKNGK